MGLFPDVWVNLITACTNVERVAEKLCRCKRHRMFDFICSLSVVQQTSHIAVEKSPRYCQEQAKQWTVHTVGQFIIKFLDFISIKYDTTKLQNDNFFINKTLIASSTSELNNSVSHITT
jgi:hypothetical protein